MTWRFVLSGVGGQGVISAGILLSEAAVVHEGRYAVQTQRYGAEMRGGLSRADVTISDDPVIYPKVEQAHALVCLHRKGLHAHISSLRPGGILIHDADEAPVTMRVDCRQYSVPIIATTRRELGSIKGANICMLGILVTVTSIVTIESLEAAIRDRFHALSPGVVSENLRALALGIRLGREHQSGTEPSDGESRSGSHPRSAGM